MRQQRARSGKNKVEEIRSSRRAGWGRLCYKRGCVSNRLWSPLCMVGSWPYYLLHLLVLFAITGHKKASIEAHRIVFSAFFVLSPSFLDLYSQPERGIIFLLIIIFFLSFGSAVQETFLQLTSESFGFVLLSFLQTARGFDGRWGLMLGSLQVERMSASPFAAPQASRWG